MLNIKYVGRKRYKPQKKAFKKLYTYRDFLPYANFITANFITAVFQNYY